MPRKPSPMPSAIERTSSRCEFTSQQVWWIVSSGAPDNSSWPAGSSVIEALSRYCATGPLRVLLVPGFMVQKITTAEPDDAQLEVALASLRVTLFRQEHGEAPAMEGDVSFPSYDALLAAPRLRAETASVRAA